MTPKRGGRVWTRARWIRRLGPIVGAVCLLSTVPAYASGSTAATSQHSGPVNVLYAGSLVQTMEKVIGPRFDAATGYTFTGFSAGSDALATQIKDGVQKGDVFISASPTVNQELAGTANGNWVSWYITFATAPLVIGYNPNSKFAARSDDQAVARRGRRARVPAWVGPTRRPTPKASSRSPRCNRQPGATSCRPWRSWPPADTGEFPEETLVGRLQAGQLDAGFFYSAEAKAAGTPTVSLGPINLAATYTVTVLNRAPNWAAAISFVSYLLGRKGRAALAAQGFKLVKPPTVHGATGKVPASLRPTSPSG